MPLHTRPSLPSIPGTILPHAQSIDSSILDGFPDTRCHLPPQRELIIHPGGKGHGSDDLRMHHWHYVHFEDPGEVLYPVSSAWRSHESKSQTYCIELTCSRFSGVLRNVTAPYSKHDIDSQLHPLYVLRQKLLQGAPACTVRLLFHPLHDLHVTSIDTYAYSASRSQQSLLAAHSTRTDESYP